MPRTRAGVTPAQDRVRARLLPKWHPSSLATTAPFRAENRMQSRAPIRRWRLNRSVSYLFLVAISAMGCSMQETKSPLTSATSSPAASSNEADGNLSGLWIGTTSTGGLLGMAGETRSIKLVLRQVGDKITGTYRCSAGNAQCRNLNETGSINGTAMGNRVNLKIMVLPDASNCRYTGTLDYNGNGQYTCYLQGQIVEQGTWVASR